MYGYNINGEFVYDIVRVYPIVNDNIFSGDTIMFEKHGKTSLPGGNEKLLISSIEKMMNTLIGDYKIYPGHRQETSLDYERKCRLSTVITGY